MKNAITIGRSAHSIMSAMEARRPFSWVKSHDVQMGVYIKHTQAYFHTYLMKGY